MAIQDSARPVVTAAREGGFDARPRPAVGHMPFAGHRTVAEVWEQEARREIPRGLGR